MVVFGDFAAPAPARAGGWRPLALRALAALGASILMVELFTISATGLFDAGAILFGAPPWFVAGLTAIIAAVSAWLFVVVFARIWDIESRIARGLAFDDVRWRIIPHF